MRAPELTTALWEHCIRTRVYVTASSGRWSRRSWGRHKCSGRLRHRPRTCQLWPYPRDDRQDQSRLGTVASDPEAKNPAISPRISLIKLKNSSHSFETRPLPQRGLNKVSLPIAKFCRLSVDNRPHVLYPGNTKKELIMSISMTVRTSGFRTWSEAHDPKIAVRAVAAEDAVISAPDLDQELMTPTERPHRPWLVPGAGTL